MAFNYNEMAFQSAVFQPYLEYSGHSRLKISYSTTNTDKHFSIYRSSRGRMIWTTDNYFDKTSTLHACSMPVFFASEILQE